MKSRKVKEGSQLVSLEELINQSAGSLPDACDHLAHTLLVGDGPPASDPFSRLAEGILSNLLLQGVLDARKARGKRNED